MRLKSNHLTDKLEDLDNIDKVSFGALAGKQDWNGFKRINQKELKTVSADNAWVFLKE